MNEFWTLTEAERAATEVWNRGSADSTGMLLAVRAAVRATELRHEQSEDAQLAILCGKAEAMAEEYEREPRLIASGAVASMLREWVGAYR
jgi:hypothetical protein